MDQNGKAKTSANFENFDKIPEDINVSLMRNDADSALCPGPLGSYACNACSDIEVYIAAFQRHWDNIIQGSGDTPIGCVAVGAHEDQEEDGAEAEAEDHKEKLVSSTDEVPAVFLAIEKRFKEFSKTFESTKEHVAEVKRLSPKELSRDIKDQLEKELDDDF